ncbi:hypothetical protein [Spirosoma montaniterrae]|uniref:Sensor of ECF-type sigma factor n=1 Tax=Spirosoma montaniterrae TaxID=1178516 RepID=A0A1P9X2Y3_9BACT|nr:hypothetical protein [Spirosoma montaniterrae]AQG81986.1 hypothetical protein AWR27_23420 [Spirosoma montaniterrae]
MKKLILIVQAFLIGVCLISSASAQTLAQVNRDEVQLIRSIWGLEKKDIVSKYMKFNDSEAAKFWPIYEEYTAGRRKLGDDRVNIIGEYGRTYQNMTDAKADELANRVFSNNIALDKLQKKYYGKFKKAVSPLRASQFLQLESYLDTAIKAELQKEIPLLGELRQQR